MENVVAVVFQGSTVGSVTFEQSGGDLSVRRTAGGFVLELPITVRLGMENARAPQPLLSNVSATLFLEKYQIGRARYDGPPFLGSVGGDKATVGGGGATLAWTDVLPALAYCEQARGGGLLRLRIELRAEGCYLLPSAMNVPHSLRGAPWPIFGTAYVTYPTEVWTKVLRELGVTDYVFLQIAIPSDPPSEWDAVWREVARARDAACLGGDVGWTSCVVAVRRALEAWADLEPEKPWPPARQEKEALVKRDRLACLRWSLHQAAHPAAHAGDDEWSREEASLMLASLCGLLAVRRPGLV